MSGRGSGWGRWLEVSLVGFGERGVVWGKGGGGRGCGGWGQGPSTTRLARKSTNVGFGIVGRKG